MSKKTFLKTSPREFVADSQEMKFDQRLIEKRKEHGFLTDDELKAHISALPEETDFTFTSAEALDNGDVSEVAPDVEAANEAASTEEA
jgi:hypothetical protein